METNKLTRINSQSHSIIATGKLRIKDGKIEQEAEVIYHKPIDGKSVGVAIEWFEIDKAFIEEIKKQF